MVRDAGEEARAEQIKRDFVSMVSHELRTPLTPLKGFLLSLVEGTVEDSAEKRQEYYRIMLRQAQRLERTVNDMLDASQIEAGGLVIDLQPVPSITCSRASCASSASSIRSGLSASARSRARRS